MPWSSSIMKLYLMLFIIQSVSCDWKPSTKEKETLCKTKECKARGEEYKKNMNTKANPCQDFYSFTCGNWHENHPGPKYYPTWSISDVMEFNLFTIMRDVLESYRFQQGDDITFHQAKMIYESCLQKPQCPMMDAKDIAREIKKIGRLPTTPLWLIHLKYLYLSGESSLFKTRVMGNQAAKDLPVLLLFEPQSAYGSIFHEDTWKPQEKQAYTDFLFLILKSLKLKDSDTVLKERIEKVFQFREKLNRIIRQNRGKKPDDFTPYTGQELDDWFSHTLRQITSTQDILWREVMAALLHYVPENLRKTRKLIAMRQKQYFLDLMDLLKATTEEVLASHMEIYFVESHLKLNDKMYKLLEETSVEPHGLYKYIKDKYYPRRHTCIAEHNMKDTLEKLLYRKWFPKDYVDIIHTMNSKVKQAIEDQMAKSTWLDASSLNDTTDKLKKVEEWIGFPPWVAGNGAPTITRAKNKILIAQATMSYATNVLYIYPAFLLPPLLSPTMPMVYNYAGMGTTLGHELYHIIYDCGQYVLKGVIVDWWKAAMRDECLKRKALFIATYNEITDRDFKSRYNIDMKSDTSSSVLENLPDVMGLEASYNAYKELALKDKSVCQTLPNFEKYTCDQMFYIAYANTYCTHYTKKTAESRVTEKTTHSITSIRINGAVAQMKNFGTTFGCPVGSPMNPLEKLDLWK